MGTRNKKTNYGGRIVKTIKEIIKVNVSKGMTAFQAENYCCQKIILNKIAKSPFADKVAIKGGVVMFNLTHELRRSTVDLDFDFIRYDISSTSLEKFIDLLNKYNSIYKVSIRKMEDLHQEDYKGKRLWILINDGSYKLKFKIDIGVHTLLDIKQKDLCFYFDDDEGIFLKVNPPEQICAEKIYSLAKHGALSLRFKDLYDLYYFIHQGSLDRNALKKSLELLALNSRKGIDSLEKITSIVIDTFKDDEYIKNFKTAKDKWIDVDEQEVFDAIIGLLKSLNTK